MYVGRRHVEDGRGDPVVVDWRARASTPFYRATWADPMGLLLRRRFMVEGGGWWISSTRTSPMGTDREGAGSRTRYWPSWSGPHRGDARQSRATPLPGKRSCESSVP